MRSILIFQVVQIGTWNEWRFPAAGRLPNLETVWLWIVGFAGDRLEFAVEAVWECNDKLHTVLTIERLSC
jgi:hypothetical protein